MGRLIRAVVNCQPHEVAPLLLMFLHSCCTGLAYQSYSAAANALFLTKFDAQSLSYVYIAGTVVSVLFSLGYARLQTRLRYSHLVVLSLSSLAALTLLFRACLIFSDSKALVMTIRVAFELLYVVEALVYWGVASLLFNIQQGKRFFGLIRMGEAVTGICFGLCVPLLTRIVDVREFFVLSAVGYAGCAALLIVNIRKHREAFAQGSTHEAEGAGAERLGIRAVLRNRYTALIVVFCACVNLGWLFADFSLYDVVGARYKDEKEIAAFLGVFNSTWSAVLLIMRGYFAGWLLTRCGVKLGLLSLPLVLAAPVALTAVMGLSGCELAAVFWIVLFAKLSTEVLQSAMSDPSMRILYQSLPAGQRISLQTIVEGMVMPLSFGLGGVFLWALGRVMHFNAIHATYVLAPLVAVWLIAVFVLYRTYGETLKKALARRSLTVIGLELGDASTRNLVHKYLTSANAAEALYALHLLEEDPKLVRQEHVAGLLSHASAKVRLAALRFIEQHRLAAQRDRAVQVLEREADPTVLGQALRALPALDESTGIGVVAAYLKDQRPEVRRGAMSGLLCHCGLEGVLCAGPLLLEWAGSRQPEDRALAAAVLGDVGIKTFHQPLATLLEDPDRVVRAAALAAAARVAHPALLPGVYRNLAQPATSQLACAALAAMGAPAVAFLDQAFGDERTTPSARIWILKALRRTGGGDALAALKKRLDDPLGSLRGEAATGLHHLGYLAQGAERDQVTGTIRQECAHAALAWAAQDDLEGQDCHLVLQRALEIEVERATERVFLLLSLLHADRAIQDARAHLKGAGQKRSLALEWMDQTLSRELKDLLFPLIEALPRAARRERLQALLPVEKQSVDERLDQVLCASSRFSAWTQACVAYWIGLRGGQTGKQRLSGPLSGDALVQESARWARERMAAGASG